MNKREVLLSAAAWPLAAATQMLPAEPPPTMVVWPSIRLLDGTGLPAHHWQGKAAVVVFWATYCAFCQRHNAHIEGLHRSMRGQGLEVLGAALDISSASVSRYMDTHGYSFPVTIDAGGLRTRFTARRVIPTTCFVDRGGQLRMTIPGEMAADDVQDLARQLLRARG